MSMILPGDFAYWIEVIACSVHIMPACKKSQQMRTNLSVCIQHWCGALVVIVRHFKYILQGCAIASIQ